MDGQEYLSQIAQDNTRPKKQTTGKGGLGIDFSKIFHSKIFLWSMVAVVILIIIMAVTTIMSSGKKDAETLAIELQLHIDDTAEMIDEYQDSIKASSVRANATSLYGILVGTSMNLTTFLKEAQKSKGATEKQKLAAEEAQTALNETLFEAKITGQLNFIFSDTMDEEISAILDEEYTLYEATDDETLKSSLEGSYDSLINLQNSFRNYSANE